MSTQSGNGSRTRPQKYQNRVAYKNNLHDTSHKTKKLNAIQVSEVCEKCRAVIEWKIKYKKYKPLTQAKKCVKCEEKKVKKAYTVLCSDCGKKHKICTKCLESKEIVPRAPSKNEELKMDLELKQMLQTLSERKRRTFIRYMNKKKSDDTQDTNETAPMKKEELVKKLNALKVDDEENDSDFDYSDFSDNEDDEKDDDDDKDSS
ncbi:PREDICTED: uncharacterized protein C9orf85 homolog [Nicrophorus vespilloides]|uniref:Uncharacterized protein C9orf85 homolog n=1 Tax=Nicrophorus vespilloides TaxID=110193 RepID=A0ABM1M0A3_NICVS|nr:PREDICTED: uncharacterized protein C9orf85 homolog [Nicrophorus vespilloides]